LIVITIDSGPKICDETGQGDFVVEVVVGGVDGLVLGGEHILRRQERHDFGSEGKRQSDDFEFLRSEDERDGIGARPIGIGIRDDGEVGGQA
jgi:hypothetical protein